MPLLQETLQPGLRAHDKGSGALRGLQALRSPWNPSPVSVSLECCMTMRLQRAFCIPSQTDALDVFNFKTRLRKVQGLQAVQVNFSSAAVRPDLCPSFKSFYLQALEAELASLALRRRIGLQRTAMSGSGWLFCAAWACDPAAQSWLSMFFNISATNASGILDLSFCSRGLWEAGLGDASGSGEACQQLRPL